MQDLVEGVLSAVELRGIVRVLADGCSGKIDTGKESLGARPRKQFGFQRDVSRGLGIAPDGASRGRSISPNLELAMKQGLKTLVIYSDKHHICGLAAELQAKRSTAQANENRSAPTMCSAAGHDTLAIFPADNESALLHSGYYADADCLLRNTVRDRFVRCGHDLLNHGLRVIDPCV